MKNLLLDGELDVSVVLPTRNGAGNSTRMINEISRALTDNNLTGEIIVVNDDSAHGTAVRAEQQSARSI